MQAHGPTLRESLCETRPGERLVPRLFLTDCFLRMDLHPLGTTAHSVTPLGLGLAALGRPGYINLGHAEALEGRRSVNALQQHTHAVLDAAWDAGIRYIDAARSYGRAEAFLRSWLDARRHSLKALTVGSKWGYTYTADWQVDADVHEVKDHSLDTLQRQWSVSEATLGDALDLYQIHSATLQTGVLEDKAVHAALARLRDEHSIAIGLSLSGPQQAATLEQALAVTVAGIPLFDTVQATWNVLEPSAGPMLAAAHADGRGVIVKEALANGRLTPANTRPDDADLRATLDAHAERLGTSSDALALAAALSQPWADVVLSGAATLRHVRSNVQALAVDWDDDAAAALRPFQEPADRYWDLRSALAWT